MSRERFKGHTPRPWFVEKYAPFGWNIREPHRGALGVGTILATLNGYGAGPNAELMAAAPTLLAENETLKAEIAMLRGEGCMEGDDGPCGACIKCALAGRHVKSPEEQQRLATELSELRNRLNSAQE